MYENLWTNLEKYSRSRNLACAAIIIAAFLQDPGEWTESGIVRYGCGKSGCRSGIYLFYDGKHSGYLCLKGTGYGRNIKKRIFLCTGCRADTDTVSLCRGSAASNIACAFFHVYAAIGRRKENDGVSNAVYRSNYAGTCGCFCRISGTETVFPEGGVFVCDTGCHCHGLHYDWMVHRRILQTKNGRRPGKTGA